MKQTTFLLHHVIGSKRCGPAVNTCLWRVLSKPGESPVSVFWVATFISNLSLTGKHSPLDSALKYLGEDMHTLLTHMYY